jgi:hypothetical protein
MNRRPPGDSAAPGGTAVAWDCSRSVPPRRTTWLPHDPARAAPPPGPGGPPAARLRHPNICQVHDVGQHDGVPYLTMAYVAGRPLSELVPTFPDRPREAAAPCVSQETFHLVGDRFLFRPDNPRRVELKGLGAREVYDVVGRKEPSSSGFLRR